MTVFVGLVHIKNKKFESALNDGFLGLKGSREHIRLSSVDCALDCLLTVLE